MIIEIREEKEGLQQQDISHENEEKSKSNRKEKIISG